MPILRPTVALYLVVHIVPFYAIKSGITMITILLYENYLILMHAGDRFIEVRLSIKRRNSFSTIDQS